ncbi:hypothetical protein N9F34_03920 [Alphaproteobacteria bacterium]|nr:hypothetical protein [Alphaproteobacteria bacterium]
MIEFPAKPLSTKALYNRISAIIEAPRNFIRTDDYFARIAAESATRRLRGPSGGKTSVDEVAEDRQPGFGGGPNSSNTA